ncbi:MAG: hypothetical protein MUD14_15830 [Hydrococcus sp. Prado102]|nr:hypothetical protein [Hydrococcus sp. Prado102]
MAIVKISELAGSALFSDSETFMDSMRDLTEDELKISGGGRGKGTSKTGSPKSPKSKTNTVKSKKSYSY